MEKLAYLLWNEGLESSPDAFRDRLLGGIPAPLADGGATGLTVSVIDSDVAAGEGLHMGPHKPDALVSFWLECCQDRQAAEAVLAAHARRHAGYLVVESHPLRLETPASARGQRTQGFSLVGCIEAKPGISHLDFVDIWERIHRDVAIETQSTFSYVRNEVVRSLTRDAPAWGGIVEEGFPSSALSNPQAFYDAVGDEPKYQANLKRMMDSVEAFLWMEKVDSHPMSEYRFG